MLWGNLGDAFERNNTWGGSTLESGFCYHMTCFEKHQKTMMVDDTNIHGPFSIRKVKRKEDDFCYSGYVDFVAPAAQFSKRYLMFTTDRGVTCLDPILAVLELLRTSHLSCSRACIQIGMNAV